MDNTEDTGRLVAALERCKGQTYGARFRQIYTLEDAIEFNAFAPLEALASVRPLPFLSGVHSSYRLAL
jgi:hypothetical protein